MNRPVDAANLTRQETAEARWQQDYAAQTGADRTVFNRSGIEVKPLYTSRDWSAEHGDALGFPGQPLVTV